MTFTIAGEVPTEEMSCNGSHCRCKGLLPAFVGDGALSIVGAEALVDDSFHRHAIVHRFCRTCGCQPLAVRGGGAAVHLRCVSSIDLDTLTIREVDGARFWAFGRAAATGRATGRSGRAAPRRDHRFRR